MRKRSRKTGIFIVIIGVILGLFFIRLVKQGYTIYQTHKETVKTEERVKQLEAEQKSLTEEKENLGDIKYIEKIAREEHNMVRNGEIPLFIIEDKDKKQEGTQGEEKPAEKSTENAQDNSQEKQVESKGQ